MTQLQNLQAHIASIKDEGASMSDLTAKYASLSAMFHTNDDQMTYLLTQPPLTFLVSLSKAPMYLYITFIKKLQVVFPFSKSDVQLPLSHNYF